MAPKQQKPSKGKWQVSVHGWKNSAYVRFFLFIYMTGFLFVLLSGSLLSETYDIEQGTASQTTILAKERIENVAATEKARQDAAAQVGTVYANVSFPHSRLIDSIYNKLEQINTDPQFTTEIKAEIYRNFFPDELNWHTEQLLIQLEQNHNESLLSQVREQFGAQRYRIPEEVYFKFTSLTVADLQEMEPVTKDIVGRLMNEQVINANTARDKVAEQVNA